MIAILGTGPAAMFAAHACVVAGREDFVVYGPPVKSQIRGAIYLHKSIPGLTLANPTATVQYIKRGTPQQYSRKVYGMVRDDVSWHNYEAGYHNAWDMRAAYDAAFEKYSYAIHEKHLGYEDIHGLTNTFDLVINTVPLTAYTRTGVSYMWADAFIRVRELDDPRSNWIIYSGNEVDHWYRDSNLFGWQSTEYGQPAEETFKVRKPLGYVGQVVPDSWLCVGRYGAWGKTGLAHDGYFETLQRLRSL